MRDEEDLQRFLKAFLQHATTHPFEVQTDDGLSGIELAVYEGIKAVEDCSANLLGFGLFPGEETFCHSTSVKAFVNVGVIELQIKAMHTPWYFHDDWTKSKGQMFSFKVSVPGQETYEETYRGGTITVEVSAEEWFHGDSGVLASGTSDRTET
jgi:hypothetical protein